MEAASFDRKKYFKVSEPPSLAVKRPMTSVTSWQVDHDLEPSTPLRCTGFNYQENSVVEYGSYPPFAYDAMWTAAHALHTLLYTNSTKNFSSSFPTIDDRVKFFDAIVETDFIGASGRVKFFADGDRSTNEIFLQHTASP